MIVRGKHRDTKTAAEQLFTVPTTADDLNRVIRQAQAAAGPRGRVVWIQESTTGWARIQALAGDRVVFCLNPTAWGIADFLDKSKTLARPAGLEPATPGLEGRCSIHLSSLGVDADADPKDARRPRRLHADVMSLNCCSSVLKGRMTTRMPRNTASRI